MHPNSFTQLNNEQNPYLNITFVAGFICAMAYGYLSIQSQAYGEASLFDLYLTSSIVCVASMAAWIYCHLQSKPINFATVLLWAIIFRIIGIAGFPVLEDDFYRYLWDGYQLVTSGSPYSHPPIYYFSLENIPASFEAILDGINYPHISTVYGPLCQWLFALSYLIAPGEIWPLQLILSLLDILLIYLLSRVAQAKYILLYAWNPLIIKEIAFSAHPDILGVFFMMLAILIFRKNIYLTAVCCALAVGSKVFALVIVPLLIGLHWRAWGIFFLTIILISLPFIHDFLLMTQGLTAMAELWLFNAPIYFIFLNLISALSLKITMLILFAGIWCVYAWNYLKTNNTDKIPRGDILFGVFLLCIPALNPWYIIWILPFAVIYPSYWAWTSSIAVFIAYVIGINLNSAQLGPYEQPWWAITLEFSIIALALKIDFIKNTKNRSITSE